MIIFHTREDSES